MGHLAWLALTTSEQHAVTLRGFLVGAVMEVSYLLLWFRFYYVSYLRRGGKKYAQHKADNSGSVKEKAINNDGVKGIKVD